MRKDMTADTASVAEEDETAFVERYWTEVWERQGGPQEAVAKVPRRDEFRVMRPYLERLPKGATLLDGGSGLGDWTIYFTREGWPTIGLDISRKTVTQLNDRFPDMDFRVGDIRETGLAADSVDGYFSWGTFEHFEGGLDPCIAEAYRVLKPGGYLFVSVPFDNLRHALRAGFDLRRRAEPDARPTRFYQWRLTRGELRDVLARGGFRVLDIKSIHKRQGVLRSLHIEFGMSYEWTLTRGMAFAAAPFVPGGLIAHMLLGVAQKPRDAAA